MSRQGGDWPNLRWETSQRRVFIFSKSSHGAATDALRNGALGWGTCAVAHACGHLGTCSSLRPLELPGLQLAKGQGVIPKEYVDPMSAGCGGVLTARPIAAAKTVPEGRPTGQNFCSLTSALLHALSVCGAAQAA